MRPHGLLASFQSKPNAVHHWDEELFLNRMFFFSIINSELSEPERTLNVLLRPRPLPGHIQGVYVQNILKLFTRIVTACLEKNDTQQIVHLCNLLMKKLPTFTSSGHIEVQERASSAFVLIEMLHDQLKTCIPDRPTANDMLGDLNENDEALEPVTNEIPLIAIEIVHEMAILFAGDLNPVAPKAQRKVQVPDGLNLDEWINPPPADSSSSSEDDQADLFVGKDERTAAEGQPRHVELSKEDLHKVF